MELLIKQFSQLSCHLVPLGSKKSPQCPVLCHHWINRNGSVRVFDATSSCFSWQDAILHVSKQLGLIKAQHNCHNNVLLYLNFSVFQPIALIYSNTNSSALLLHPLSSRYSVTAPRHNAM
jgi:hypothetical protein